MALASISSKLRYHKQAQKVAFYASGYFQRLVPKTYFRRGLDRKLARLDQLPDSQRERVLERVAFYHPWNEPFAIPESALPFSQIPRRKTTYYLDFVRLLRHFPTHVRTAFRFGDVTDVTTFPRLVKTRPINEPHESSILLRLNAIRHYRTIHDPIPYRDKKDCLVWRGKARKAHRLDLLRKHFDTPHCDLGNILPALDREQEAWVKPFMTVTEQLGYKFILSIEGNEVATNLKWIAQSNSLCFMAPPRFESWFMESTLKPGFHYVALRPDYADLSEKIDHYLAHPAEAEEIIHNLQDYYRGFTDPDIEELAGLLVVQKYLQLSGQIAG